MKSAELKRIHREEANAPQEIRNQRTPAMQLVELDKMFGKGQGAKRERTRLQKIIDAAKVQDAPESGESVKDANNNAQNARKEKAAKHNKELAEK